MKAYVVERGVYSDRYVEGVYATPEAAMAANPGGTWEACEDTVNGVVWRRWVNGLDWDSAGHIVEYEVLALEKPRTVLTVALMTRALRAWDDQATETQAEIVLAALAAEKATSK